MTDDIGANEESPIRQGLISRGMELPDDWTDDQIIGEFVDGFNALKAYEPDQLTAFNDSREEFERYRAQQADFRRWQESQQEPAKNEPKQPTGWEPLAYNDEWDSVTQLDEETGAYVPKGPYGSQKAADDRNRYVREQEQRQRKLVTNPYETIMEAGLQSQLDEWRESLLEEAKKSVLGTLDQRSAEQRINAAISHPDNDLVQMGDSGPLTDVKTGDYVLTERGRIYHQAWTEGHDLGITDLSKLHGYALKQAQAAQVSTPSETNEKQKQTFRERINKSGTSRPTDHSGATVNNPEPRQAEDLSFKELFKQTETEQLT